MKRGLQVLVICLIWVLTSHSLPAQSTSPWKKVGEATFGKAVTPSPGNAYMTVYVRAATVYQNSNWWTNFVESNRQAVLTANIDGTISGTHVTQTRTGNPIDLRKNKTMVDLGFSGIVVDHLPTTFSGMTFDLQINKTAQDGLKNLMSAVSDLSKAQPPVLSVSQQAMGIASFSKSVADFLFKNNLLVKELATQSPIPSTGILAPGVYICLAGDSESDYQAYLAPGNPGLQWTGTEVTYNNVPIQRVSYFVVEIGYQPTFFNEPLDSLSFGAVKSWATLYQLASREIPKINSAAEATKILNDIQSHLADAGTLLDADPDFIQSEKDAIANAVYTKINDDYHARLKSVGVTPEIASDAQPQVAPPVGGTQMQPTTLAPSGSAPLAPPRPNLIPADGADQAEQHQNIMRQIELNDRVLQPTTMSPK